MRSCTCACAGCVGVGVFVSAARDHQLSRDFCTSLAARLSHIIQTHSLSHCSPSRPPPCHRLHSHLANHPPGPLSLRHRHSVLSPSTFALNHSEGFFPAEATGTEFRHRSLSSSPWVVTVYYCSGTQPEKGTRLDPPPPMSTMVYL